MNKEYAFAVTLKNDDKLHFVITVMPSLLIEQLRNIIIYCRNMYLQLRVYRDT